MKTKRIMTFIMAAGLILSAAYSVSAAETKAPEAKHLALRGIMKDLGSNMQVITDAISREDWVLAEKTAPLIADHPQPPVSEKTRIIGFVGSNIGKFKGYDEVTHQAAKSLEQAASEKDGPAVIAAFKDLQTACYSCHRDFRKPFLEHFYGGR